MVKPRSSSSGEPDHTHIIIGSVSFSSFTGSRKVVLEHKKGSEDGFGVHLSGGLPPVTVTYVKPGGQAEKAGVEVGDVILDVNGLNCRKKVDITQVMELKMLVQQQHLGGGNTEHIDVSYFKPKLPYLRSGDHACRASLYSTYQQCCLYSYTTGGNMGQDPSKAV